MSKTPFMPLWVSDFLGDTLDLDATEIGAYMLLLMAQWNRNGKSLPDDGAKLRRVARCGRNWPTVWGNIERYFERDDDGVFSPKGRLVFASVDAKRTVNAQSGGLGGKAKALKVKEQDLANATQTLERKATILEPEPYRVERDTNVSCADFADFWDAYPHRNGAKKNRKGGEAAFIKALKAGATVSDIAQGVEDMLRSPDVVRGYARDPTTWLNQRGWTDEVSPTLSAINGGLNDNRNINAKDSRADTTTRAIAFAGSARRIPSADSF